MEGHIHNVAILHNGKEETIHSTPRTQKTENLENN